MNSSYARLLIFLALSSLASLAAQDGRTNPPPKVFRDRVEPHWFGDTNHFWYRVLTAEDQHDFILVDAPKGTREPAFDSSRLAAALKEKTGKEIVPGHWPFESLEFSADQKSVKLVAKDTAWACDLATYELTEQKSDKPADADESTRREGRRRGRGRPDSPAGKSPDTNWQAVVRGHNLFLRDLRSDKERPLTYDANPGNSYARDFDRARGVGMEYETKDPEIPASEEYWSPDSKHLVAMRTRAGTRRTVYLVESSPKDQLQPKLDSYPYLKPGDEIPLRKPHLFDVESAKEIPLDDALFPNPWEISEVRWAPDSSRFSFLYNQRGHQILRLVSIDASSGVAKTIVEERSDTFIDYSGKMFTEYLDDTGEIVWMSERDGWNHLYLYDGANGRLKNQITKGNWVVRSVERVDKDHRQIWFRAGGIRPDQDPYYIHYCRVNFDGSDLKVLTEEDGTHSAQFSPDHQYFVDTWSRVDAPPITVLRHAQDGTQVCELERADWTALLKTGWQIPERFVAKGRDGTTDIYGVIVRPAGFDPQKKYPVLENIYAGPHDSFAPKAFSPLTRMAELADRGFVIVQMDGMGTSNRSKHFHDVCWKNLADAGFPDRILWIKAAAAKYPSLDLDRVGLYGTSAGGQNALRGLLSHGDFYKAGVSDCGCHDNRMDKIWWNEQWLGWPVDESYQACSNVRDAAQLQGKLLLMVGEMDKNVDPSSTLQVVDALIKADKDFELLVMPGAGHGVARTSYGWRRLSEFFVRVFLNSSPAHPSASEAHSTAATLNRTNNSFLSLGDTPRPLAGLQ